MTEKEEPTGGKKLGVLVELRVPKTRSRDLGAPLIEAEGLELDRGYEPVPTTPLPEVAASVEAAGEEVVTVRGVIDEDRIAELEARDDVVAVWRDTYIEPFDGP